MRIPGLKTLKKIGRQWRSRFVTNGLILGYHRVAAVADDPFDMCIQPDHFAAQMAYLHKQMYPLPLRELVERTQRGTLPARAVAVTFDDGYTDNLTTALPILEHYKIPVTFFIATGYLGNEFWWDGLARLMAGLRPELLKAAVSHLRQHDLLSLYNWLLPLPEAERKAHLEQLRQMADPKPISQTLVMTAEEINQMAGSHLVEIGSHTVTHPLLDKLTPELQAWEIQDSRKQLEAITERPIHSFSYPNGRYTPDTVALIKQTGYTVACTSFTDVVTKNSNPWCLPRLWVKHKPANHFMNIWGR